MFAAISRGLTGITGTVVRTLWSGSLAERMLVLALLVALVIFTGGLGMTALSSLMPVLLVLASLLVVYSLVIRGG